MLECHLYANVKTNPIVNRDSIGMFEEPTHGILTNRRAIAAGIPPKDAARIAIATAAMDHDASTMPASGLDVITRIPQTIRYHYPDDPFRTALGGVNRDIAAPSKGRRRKDQLEPFGQPLHTL